MNATIKDPSRSLYCSLKTPPLFVSNKPQAILSVQNLFPSNSYKYYKAYANELLKGIC